MLRARERENARGKKHVYERGEEGVLHYRGDISTLHTTTTVVPRRADSLIP